MTEPEPLRSSRQRTPANRVIQGGLLGNSSSETRRLDASDLQPAIDAAVGSLRGSSPSLPHTVRAMAAAVAEMMAGRGPSLSPTVSVARGVQVNLRSSVWV